MGRLGIIIELTVRIVLQKAVQRELQTIQIDTLIDQLTVTQHAYAAAQQNGSIIELAAALNQIDETQASRLPIWLAHIDFCGSASDSPKGCCCIIACLVLRSLCTSV